ncbi:phosphate-starvation-inducible PsiE family protein [Sinanaerobacter sp. ZZT-01]|uniref:phosphate-starvation-inducible PsiE family protein n=1 Tax=Sinanaerobacter sp. ZZT-01 TaxID=3111540 RepID=UPI002D790C13|nr:phosphate-starvation-inducible PsiE family protein [Sinanaerobacter sp. ZZT-01]WRR94917.1 phosphate-starvation-inducible PsiE family protein [Sinanaerobacter sp. ZZT-01]
MEKIKQSMNTLANLIFYLCSLLEGIISIIILLVIVIETIVMVDRFDVLDFQNLGSAQLNSILGSILWLVIGLEFIKMLMEHSHGAVLEVLLFAVARQMIVEHTSMIENFFAVAAIAGIFAIRKFLYNKEEDKEPILGNESLHLKTEKE